MFGDRGSFNSKLLALAYQLRKKDPVGVVDTNVKGWQSPNVLQNMPEFEDMNRRIVQVCQRIGEFQHFLPDMIYRHQAWVNISPPGASNSVHYHANRHFSGVYYISLQEPECGSIYFRDPRVASRVFSYPSEKPTQAQLEAWVNSPASSNDVIRDPNDIFTILQVNNTSTTNAESVKVTAFDINSIYRFSLNNIGNFRINLQATFMDEFLYQNDPSEPIRDGAGKYNDVTSAAPELPEWKANLRMGWSRDNHLITSTVHYVDSMPYDGPLFTHLDFFANTYRPANIREEGIKAWTDMDISYTYRAMDGADSWLRVTRIGWTGTIHRYILNRIYR